MTERVVSEARLREVAFGLFRTAGLSEDHAGRAVQSLVLSDVRGVSSHGVRFLAPSIRRLEGPGANATPDVRPISQAGAMELWDGDYGLGIVVGSVVMDRACELAAERGIGFVTVRHSNHYGAGGGYVSQAVERGFIGVALSNSSLGIAIHGSNGRVIGNNPIALGAPTPSFPLILDMCAGIASGMRIKLMRDAGIPIPENWYVQSEDPDVRPPMVPMGGPDGSGAKGSGIAIMSEVLTGAIAAGGMLADLMRGIGYSKDIPDDSCHTMIAIDPGAVLPEGVFAERMERLVSELKSAPPADGIDEIRLPGEHAWREARYRRKYGIQVPADVVESIEEVAAELGVTVAWD